MALIKCSECGQQISDKAKKCIHCGKEFVKEDTIKKLKCSECGNEFYETESECPDCGCPVEEMGIKKKINKKIPIIVGGVLTIAIIAGAVFFVFINTNPVSKYLHLFNMDKSKEAITVYNDKIDGNEELESELAGEQKKLMEDIFKQFKGKKLSYDEAKEQIEAYLKYAPSKQYATDVKKKMDALNGSRKAYADAQSAEVEEDIEAALKKYKAVIEEDELYTEVQDKIKELENSFKSHLLNEAESYVKNKQYKEAIADIDKIISVLGTSDELVELKNQYGELRTGQYAKIVVSDKSVTPKNTSNWIFNDFVNMVFDITNNSDKAIRGIEGTLTANDLFGKEIVSMNCDFTGYTIQPGATQRISDLSFECNNYIDEHVKFYKTEYKDLQFTYDISSIVYEDGSSIKPE